VETADLFLGAVLVARGGQLRGVTPTRPNGRGRREVSFRIAGTGLQRIVAEYQTGQATVNATTLKHALNDLRDVLFEAVRQSQE